MAKENFQRSLAAVLAHEGGYVDHPVDPGGATNMGITHKTLARWRKVSPWWNLPKSAVQNLTKDEAGKIYRAQYWNTVRGDDLPAGLDYAVFDYAVNSGPARAVKDLQRVLGVGVDGIVGVETLSALTASNIANVITGLMDRRMAFLRSLKTFPTFGRGWTRRVNEVRETAGKMASGLTLPAPRPASESQAKAPPEKPTAVDVLVKDAGGWSGIGGILAAILGAIADQPILQIGAVVLIAVLVWRFVIARQKADPA